VMRSVLPYNTNEKEMYLRLVSLRKQEISPRKQAYQFNAKAFLVILRT